MRTDFRRKKTYQQAAVNTLQLLREGKCWIVERPSTSDSSEELITWLSPEAQAALKELAPA
ncbi:MAG: hypothetical protein ACOYK6_08575 [Chthoniobacterales bacterium]